MQVLDSIARNSKSTQRTYAAGPLVFHKFLDRQTTGDTLESILDKIRKNEIDVYVILNQFVSFLLQ
jgi:hypothetical protein